MTRVYQNALTLVLDTIAIKQDTFGRYCLNDLHKASGGAEKDTPNRFFRLDTTDELVNELLQTPDMALAPLQLLRGGKTPGTYVAKELVYAYAMWISPKFHLKVIRFFDTGVTHRFCMPCTSGYKYLFLQEHHSTQGLAQALPEALKLASFTNPRKQHHVIQTHHCRTITIHQPPTRRQP